jgi:hypothetical protein
VHWEAHARPRLRHGRPTNCQGVAFTLNNSYQSSINPKTNADAFGTKGLGAAVGKLSQPGSPAAGDVFTADPRALAGALADGFVEAIGPWNGVGVVPFLPAQGNYQQASQSAYSALWFSSPGAPNYVHVIAADGTSNPDILGAYGESLPTERWTYSYIGTMEAAWKSQPTPRRLMVAEQANFAHELGHYCQVDTYSAPDVTSGGHDIRPMWCAVSGSPCSTVIIPTATTFCLMDPQVDWEVFKFCKPDLLDGGPKPAQPASIRRAWEPL